MAEEKIQAMEREYIIPLRKEWRKVASYKRTGRAVKEIKKFIAKHMKVPDRDISKVKLDIYLNNEIWFKGRTKPPAKIKVIARPDSTALLVYFNDYTAFRYDEEMSRQEMNIFVDSINFPWSDRYVALYLVGASGKSFYERLQSNNIKRQF